MLNKSEGFPTSGNDTENKYTIFRLPAVSAAGLFTIPGKSLYSEILNMKGGID